MDRRSTWLRFPRSSCFDCCCTRIRSPMVFVKTKWRKISDGLWTDSKMRTRTIAKGMTVSRSHTGQPHTCPGDASPQPPVLRCFHRTVTQRTQGRRTHKASMASTIAILVPYIILTGYIPIRLRVTSRAITTTDRRTCYHFERSSESDNVRY